MVPDPIRLFGILKQKIHEFKTVGFFGFSEVRIFVVVFCFLGYPMYRRRMGHGRIAQILVETMQTC